MLEAHEIARICHEVNRAYCESIGDDSQVEWDQAPAWQKESAVNGVKFHLEHPEATPEDTHASWMAQKKREGWIWGPFKNPEKKEHPCMVPYHMLPQEQRSKDYIFKAIVESLRTGK